MRAMVINAYGGTDQFEMADVDMPEPDARGVRVRLSYVAVNPADFKFREGLGRRFPTFRENFPMILGLEGVGEVDAIGADVTRCRVGDRVAMRCNLRAGLPGSYAAYAVTSEDAVAPVPDGLAMADAATIPVAAVTAYQAVVYTGSVAPGMTVLVHGAGGGVGSFATQFAKHIGARVAGTCSGRNTDYVRTLGVDYAIDYTGSTEDAVRQWAPDGVDVIIDCVGSHTLSDPLSLLRQGGIDVRIVTLTDSDLESPTAEEAERAGKRAVVKVVDQATAAADMESILALMAAGHVKAPDIDILPLDEVAEAHRRLEHREVRGKLLLSIG